jgi:hypothetical protein
LTWLSLAIEDEVGGLEADIREVVREARLSTQFGSSRHHANLRADGRRQSFPGGVSWVYGTVLDSADFTLRHSATLSELLLRQSLTLSQLDQVHSQGVRAAQVRSA